MNAAGDEVGERLGRAAIRHVHSSDIGGQIEQRRAVVRAAAQSGRAEVELARLLFRERDQLFHRLRSETGRDDENQWRARDLRDSGKVFDCIVRKLTRVQRRASRVIGTCRRERVAVARRIGNDLEGDDAACAGTIVDHHRLSPSLHESRANDASDGVGRAARRERHDHANGFRRIRAILRCRGRSRVGSHAYAGEHAQDVR
jgi:hypothetical protein